MRISVQTGNTMPTDQGWIGEREMAAIKRELVTGEMIFNYGHAIGSCGN